jgi:hypothetical protein
MSSLEVIYEDREGERRDSEDCDYIIQNKDNTITICKEKIEELINLETRLFYRFGLVDGFLLGVASTMIAVYYKDNMKSVLKALPGILRFRIKG